MKIKKRKVQPTAISESQQQLFDLMTSLYAHEDDVVEELAR
jgi:hypothetical protein